MYPQLFGAAVLASVWALLLFGRDRYPAKKILLPGLLVYLVLLIQTAWLLDDAFIFYRTIENFAAGHGLVWNVSERVQTFTAPAWTFLLTALYLVTDELPVTAMLASIAISLLAVALLAGSLSGRWQAGLLALFALASSKAFVEYSTAGLENPLTFLVLAAFLRLYYRPDMDTRRLLALTLLACVALLNRMDTILLVLPALLWAGLRTQGVVRTVAVFSAGFLPFVAWEVFSVLYYGFPFPNTAYAKLNTGIPAGDLFQQGLRYLRNSLVTDPLTLSVITAGVVSPLFTRARSHLPVLVGVVLYMLYIVKIGGSFIAGRHLAAPYFVAVWVLAHSLSPGTRPARLAVAAVITAGCLLVTPTPPLFSGSRYGEPWLSIKNDPDLSPWAFESQIEDSRLFYYPDTGLLSGGYATSKNPQYWVARDAAGVRAAGEEAGRIVHVEVGIGIFGTLVGPRVHVLDPVALADPLLARLPARRDIPWRMGHFERAIPEGYVETLESGENRLLDADLAQYYDQLALVLQGDLLDSARLAAIVHLNTGRYDHLIDQELYRYPPAVVEPGAPGPLPAGTLDIEPWPLMPRNGLIVRFDSRMQQPEWLFRSEPGGSFEAAFYAGDRLVGMQKVTVTGNEAGAGSVPVPVPAAAVQAGYDRIWIRPAADADGSWQVHLGSAAGT